MPNLASPAAAARADGSPRSSIRERVAALTRLITGLRARVLANMGALLVGQGVTAGIQLATLPLFLHFWDASRYGLWIMLSAVPTYFSISDGGMIPVAANRISMLYASGEKRRADVVFQSALVLVVVAIGAVGCAAGLVLLALGDGVLAAQSRLALWLLILATLCAFLGGLCEAGFRACGNYAQGLLLGNAVRVAEFCGMVAGLALGDSVASTAGGLLAGRVLGTVSLCAYCRARFPDLHWGWRDASRSELAALVKPAAAYTAFPLGNALSIQAVTLIVGGMFGTVAVAVFNTYRTISRLVLQLTSTFSHAMWNEFSRLYGARDGAGLRRFYHRGNALGAGINALLSLAMIPVAGPLLAWWSHGKIAFDRPLFLLFALATLVGGFAHVPRGLLLSTNRHSRLGVAYLVLAALGLPLTVLLGRLLGTPGVVLASTALEAMLLALTVYLVRRVLDESSGSSPHG